VNNIWPRNDTSQIPYWVYTDPEIYQQELEKIWYGPHWVYVGLECEIPAPGDFKLSWVGERQIIMVRDLDGINVVENRCPHRGVQFQQNQHGTAKRFVCPYHQWRFSLKGDLVSLPFEKGVPKDDQICGGMPEDFDRKNHGLTKLRVAVLHGVVFASFDQDIIGIEDYIGPDILPWFERTFKGRELKLLGYNRQEVKSNWKLMMENIKDPYHPGLLHTWFVSFGLFRADQSVSRMVIDSTGRHAVMLNRRNKGIESKVTKNVTTFKSNMKLNDPRLLEIVEEPWWTISDPQHPDKNINPTNCMQTIFPSVIIQQQINSMSTRQIVPKGPGVFEFTWTHFAFVDDSDEMINRRLRQANLFGPAGFVSADDGEVLELSQKGFNHCNNTGKLMVELGGRDAGEVTEHQVTETLIRGMYRYYRKIMT
jgi:salicylate 5-hydroxylase large subunit